MGNKEVKPLAKTLTRSGNKGLDQFAQGAVKKTMSGNSEKETVFVREYLKDFNGTRSATVAGYHQPSSRANSLLKKPHIIKAIKEYQAKIDQNVIVTKQMITNELAPIAFADYSQLVEMVQVTDGKGMKSNTLLFKTTEALPPGIGRLIKSMKITQKGIEVVLYDKLQALEMLGRHLEYFKDPVTSPPSNAVGIYIPDNGRGDTVNVQVNVLNQTNNAD